MPRHKKSFRRKLFSRKEIMELDNHYILSVVDQLKAARDDVFDEAMLCEYDDIIDEFGNAIDWLATLKKGN